MKVSTKHEKMMVLQHQPIIITTTAEFLELSQLADIFTEKEKPKDVKKEIKKPVKPRPQTAKPEEVKLIEHLETAASLPEPSEVKPKQSPAQQKRKQKERKPKRPRPPLPELIEKCLYCSAPFLSLQFEKHMSSCPSLPDYYSQQTFTRLNNIHHQILKHMQIKSSLKHFESTLKLHQKLTGFGLLPELELLRQYIERDCPIIIHIHIAKHMELYLKDTHYRNQFETLKTSGCSNLTTRGGWETKMFDKLYDKAEKHERVKYGTINFTNDPNGVRACYSYGNSYFVLKKEVRHRCTLTDQDSSSFRNIGTLGFCNQVLNSFTKNEIEAAIKAAKGQVGPSTCIATYKEVQIHGPIEFSRDIEKLCVNISQYKTPEQMDLVERFSKQFNIPFEVFTP